MKKLKLIKKFKNKIKNKFKKNKIKKISIY